MTVIRTSPSGPEEVLNSDDIVNVSAVAGATVSDAIDSLATGEGWTSTSITPGVDVIDQPIALGNNIVNINPSVGIVFNGTLSTVTPQRGDFLLLRRLGTNSAFFVDLPQEAVLNTDTGRFSNVDSLTIRLTKDREIALYVYEPSRWRLVSPTPPFANTSLLTAASRIIRDSAEWTTTNVLITDAELENYVQGAVSGRAILAGTGARIQLTGAQLGEIIRESTAIQDTTSSGTIAQYDASGLLTVATTQVLFNISVDIIIQGITNINGKTLQFLCQQGMTGSVTFQNEANGGFSIRTPTALPFTIRAGEGTTMTYWLSRWAVRSIARAISPEALAISRSNRAVRWSERVAFTASGATGVQIDVPIYSANAPFAMRIEEASLRLSVAGGTAAALRTAAAGGGSVILPDSGTPAQTFATVALGRRTDNANASAAVAANGTVILNIDRACTGEVTLECVRT